MCQQHFGKSLFLLCFCCDAGLTQDLMYFYKIAAALGMQSVVSVSSVKQMLMALSIPDVKMVSINNRNMATWVLDNTRVSRILGDSEGES